MAAQNAVRAALLGYGLAGEVFHAPLIAATQGMRLATIVTSNRERQERARARHPGARIIDRADQLWDLASQHDLAVVATPNRQHVPQTRAALGVGLNVVVDKPMAPSATQARGLVELARERGLLLTVFHNRRWDSEILTLRCLIEDGALGVLQRVESRIERWRPDVVQRWRESADPEDAGGVLFDLGSHLVDQSLHLFGWPSHVYAEIAVRRPDAVVDDDVFVALTYAGGLEVQLWASLVAAAAAPRLRALGLRGGYVVDRIDAQEDALRAGAVPGGPRWGEVPQADWGLLDGVDGDRRVESIPGAWPEFYVRLLHALRGDGPPPVPPEEAVAVLDVLEAARHSAAGASVIPLVPRTRIRSGQTGRGS